MSRHGWSVAVFHPYSFQQPGSVPITSSTFPGPQIYMQIVRLIFFYFYPYFLFPSSVCVLWCSKHQVKNSKYCFYINATGCHFTGPVALRRRLSSVLPISILEHLKLYKKTDFIILPCSTLHKKNLTALTLKNNLKTC